MNINKKPQCFATWLNMMMLLHDVDDEMMAKKIGMTSNTIQSWKGRRNLPKLLPLLKVLDYLSTVSGTAPSDLMDEALESIHEYREINKQHRLRVWKEKDDDQQ